MNNTPHQPASPALHLDALSIAEEDHKDDTDNDTPGNTPMAAHTPRKSNQEHFTFVGLLLNVFLLKVQTGQKATTVCRLPF